MAKRIIITEEQFNQILKEELGIAKEVILLTKEIENKIDYLLKNNQTGTLNISDGLKLNFNYFNFNDYEELNSWLQTNYSKNKNGYSFSKNTIYITIIAVNNMFDTNVLSDTIQHEVHHYYQAKKSGKSFSSDKYQLIAKNMASNNDYLKYLNQMLYFSKKFEIEGWINGAYNVYKNNRITSYKDFIDNTELYKVDGILKDVFDFFSTEPFYGIKFQQMLIYISDNGLYKNVENLKELRKKILDDCQNTYNMFVRKASRAFCLLKQEYDDLMYKNHTSGLNKHIDN